ncbi:hypothetical protein HPP92_002429 [Vanilla planifolia]|uniref:Uncharacterized protein n=1 Tax=Vanilla planifolia TaxID=51239 RepID=A0A835VKL1_VANPL|nr:hypothetical protein HPP92_002429 [Vanilla planifolia]
MTEPFNVSTRCGCISGRKHRRNRLSFLRQWRLQTFFGSRRPLTELTPLTRRFSYARSLGHGRASLVCLGDLQRPSGSLEILLSYRYSLDGLSRQTSEKLFKRCRVVVPGFYGEETRGRFSRFACVCIAKAMSTYRSKPVGFRMLPVDSSPVICSISWLFHITGQMVCAASHAVQRILLDFRDAGS